MTEKTTKLTAAEQVSVQPEENVQLTTEARTDLNEVLTIEQEAEKRNISVQQWHDLLHVRNAMNKPQEWIDKAFSFPGNGIIRGLIMEMSNSTELTSLPDMLSVGGLTLEGCHSLNTLPRGLLVGENYSLIGPPSIGMSTSEGVPKGFIEFGALYLIGCTSLTSLPDDLIVESNVYLSNNLNEQVIKDAERLKKEGKIKGSLIFRNPDDQESAHDAEADEANKNEAEEIVLKPCKTAKDFYRKMCMLDYESYDPYDDPDEDHDNLKNIEDAQDILEGVKEFQNGPLVFLLEMENLRPIMDDAIFQEARNYSEKQILHIFEMSVLDIGAHHVKSIFVEYIDVFKRNMSQESFEAAVIKVISQSLRISFRFLTEDEETIERYSKYLDKTTIDRVKEMALGFMFNYAETRNGCGDVIDAKDAIQKFMKPEEFNALIEIAKLSNELCFPRLPKHERTIERADKIKERINGLRGILSNHKEVEEGRHWIMKNE